MNTQTSIEVQQFIEQPTVPGPFAPDKGELAGIETGLRGWRQVQGLGPDYFTSPEVGRDLLAFFRGSLSDAEAMTTALAAGRSRVVNFFQLLSGSGDYIPLPAASFVPETRQFLAQVAEQAEVWRRGAFHALDMSPAEIEILTRVSVMASPVLFYMGFADAKPHSSQVSRLCASMARTTLNGRHSEVLMAALVGLLHDPKFAPGIDVGKQNLATHPINAVALASAIFADAEIEAKVQTYFHGNRQQSADFVAGLLDALGVNNDSWFVQMIFVLPQFNRRIDEKYGANVAAGLKTVMAGRLESASKGVLPPILPAHLHGCLAQEKFDSGLRGISLHGWQKGLSEAGIETSDAASLFNALLDGNLGSVTQAQISKLRASLQANSNAVLTAQISAARMLHHHQDVIASGRVAAEALVIADPMMLSAHKIGAVYVTPVIDRIKQYVSSFDDNIRLLPCGNPARIGLLWQRAVYLGLLLASDQLTGAKQVAAFGAAHSETPIDLDIADLRALIGKTETWGDFASAAGAAAANATVKQALDAIEAAYVLVVNQYREATYGGSQHLEKFLPAA